MKIIDRYIFLQFTRMIVLWFMTFVGIYIVFDLLTNFDSFSKSGGEKNFFLLIGEYYFFKSFIFIDVVLALLILISALTVVSNMIRHNEVIALMSIGVSNFRVILPILIASAAFSLLSLWTREFYLPRHIDRIVMTPKEMAKKESLIPVKRLSDAVTGITFDGGGVAPNEGRIDSPKFNLPFRMAEHGKTIAAENALWRAKTETMPEGYLLQKVSAGLLTRPSIDIDGDYRSKERSGDERPKAIVIFTPVDFPNELAADECFIASGVMPEVLAVGDDWKLYTSTAQLIRAIKNPSLSFNKTDLQVRIHSRILRPLADLLPLFLGLPILFLKSDRKIFKGMAIGMVLAGLYMGASYSAQFLGAKFDAPILGAWLPMLFFLPIVVCAFAELKEK